jgi:hypothetical protein
LAFDLAQNMAEVEATGKRKELIEEYTSTNLLEIFMRRMRKAPSS